MSSRQNFSSPQVLNSQTASTGASTTNIREKSSHSKTQESSKFKHGKVIHKFTSESYLRLISEKSSTTNVTSNYDEKHNIIDKSSSSSSSSTTGNIALSSNTIINNMSKRKGTSFQITSVSVSSANSQYHQQHVQRNSTDNNNGDDSADDLDDSHTDDNISRITDYETPSISETFSGEDVFFASQSPFGTAPVIPTSSQYGLAIVGPPDLGGNGTNLSDVHVSVTDAGINIMGPISSKTDGDHKNERFKVVKIESTEPFKRGRWMCMDYLDHTTLHDDGIDGKEGDEHSATAKDESNEYITGPKVLIMNNGEIEHAISDNEELDHEVNKINSNNLTALNSHHHHHSQDITQNSHQTTASHPQTMTSIPTYIDHSSSSSNIIHNQTAQSMPQGQIEKIITQEKLTLNLHDNNSERIIGIASSNNNSQNEKLPQPSNENNNNNTNNNNINNNNNSNTSQQQSNQFGSINSTQSNYIEHQQHAQTMTQEMIHNMMHHDQQQQHPNFHQGVTLPANILLQNIGQDHHIQQSQLNSPNSSNALPLSSIQQQQQPIPTQNININVTENASNNSEIEFSNSNNINSSNNNNNNQDPMTSQFQTTQVVTGDRIQSESDNHQQAGNLVTNENSNNINNSNNNNNNSDSNNNITVSNDGTQQNVSSPSGGPGSNIAEGTANNNVNDINESASNSVNSGNNNSNATVGADDGQAISEDNESASGTSAVAIDNKIEQAMDLVKSHLMFAVREEVEVLKEKIAELMDRINQLEVENTILKANASQETLSQLTTAATIVSPLQQQQSASPVVPQNPPSQAQQQQLQINATAQPQTTQASPNTQNQAAS